MRSRTGGWASRFNEICHDLTTTIFSQIYLGGVIYFGANAALASISAFLPTIIKTFGYSGFTPLVLGVSSLIVLRS